MAAARNIVFISLENEPNPHNYLCASYRYFFEQTAPYMQAWLVKFGYIHPLLKVEWCLSILLFN